ncbi:MAG TPA: hypothetical protein VHZ24_05270 [Pirellulales bacterium]|jgi:hypothetical protein|nr:hypothetical protein [Pirellulales bacterium]
MTVSDTIGQMLGRPRAEAIEQITPSLAAGWAQGHGGLVLLACAAIALVVGVLYYRRAAIGHRGVRGLLAAMRAAVCCLLLLLLAEPTLVVRIVRQPRPLVWLLFDGTESMSLRDQLATSDRQALDAALDMAVALPTTSDASPARIDYVRQLIHGAPSNVLGRLQEKFRLKALVFDRATGVRSLPAETADGSRRLDGAKLARQLTTDGRLTALGAALAGLGQRHATSQLAGLIVFSDFDQNSGITPLGPAAQLGVPIYTVGVGPAMAIDLAVELDAPRLMKKSESSTITVALRQTGLDGRKVPVRLSAQRLGSDAETPPIVLGQQELMLDGPSAFARFPFTPPETGRWLFTALVPPEPGEVVRENNTAERQANVRDDFLHVMFVEHEPSWEWRFIKEVFHRDPLVGPHGFRTFLRSADPKVRQTNELFLASLTPPRSEFFANDVILLGDMPDQTLSTRFCERVKEFVGMFGGGLIVMAGPSFGLAPLARTPLADMLPVVIDPEASLRDAQPFKPRVTPTAAQYDFMQLAPSAGENRKAWANLGALPWYQPVDRVRDGAAVLLAHPSDYCSDGKTPQPLVALRPYGKGQVVYLAFDETWRLRRKFGERYYRRFWGQMIYRLGLGHALGNQKRFLVCTDRQRYQVDDEVTVTVEAYDENYEPLAEDALERRSIAGTLVPPRSTAPAASAEAPREQPLTLTAVRPGIFETRAAASLPGDYHIRIEDPITHDVSEVVFHVTNISVEHRSAVRNDALQNQLAATTGGKSYDLLSAAALPDDIVPPRRTESSIEVLPLGSTWGAFLVVVGLLLSEWLLRRLVHLP